MDHNWKISDSDQTFFASLFGSTSLVQKMSQLTNLTLAGKVLCFSVGVSFIREARCLKDNSEEGYKMHL